MQIRIGNKQDETSVRSLVSEVLGETGGSLNLEGADRDLRTIEGHYFGHDGVFLVAEEDRKILGFAAAVKQTETACELKRLYVKRENRGQGIGTRLLRQIISFSRSLDYDELVVPVATRAESERQFLCAHGFTASSDRLWLKLTRSPVDNFL